MDKKPEFEIVDKRHSQRTDEDRAREAEEVERIRKHESVLKRMEAAQQKERMRQASDTLQKQGSDRVQQMIEGVLSKESKESHCWIEVDFTIALANINGMMVPLGKCVGRRDDDKLCVVEYVFTPKVEENFLWTKEARKRLDTYLNCLCSDLGQCAIHQGNPWIQEGMARLQQESQVPMSPILELYYRAEQARQNPRIHRP